MYRRSLVRQDSNISSSILILAVLKPSSLSFPLLSINIPGEEINISYLGPPPSTQSVTATVQKSISQSYRLFCDGQIRGDYLKSSYGFLCRCQMCQSEERERTRERSRDGKRVSEWVSFRGWPFFRLGLQSQYFFYFLSNLSSLFLPLSLLFLIKICVCPLSHALSVPITSYPSQRSRVRMSI